VGSKLGGREEEKFRDLEGRGDDGGCDSMLQDDSLCNEGFHPEREQPLWAISPHMT